MAPRRSPREKLQERKKALAKVHAEIEELTRIEAERIGRLAVDAGLADVEIPDDRLSEAFRDLAARLGTSGEASPGEEHRDVL